MMYRCLRNLPGFRGAALIAVLSILNITVAVSQTSWFKYEGNPILDIGPPGAWDQGQVMINRVIFRDSLYRMWYTGWRSVTEAHIGTATSPDGIRWTKEASNPVLAVTEPWEVDRTFWPYVTVVGSQYKMWYTGAGAGSVGYATSIDGVVWKKHVGNPILTRGPSGWDAGAVGWPCVLGPDSAGGYKMWFEGMNASYTTDQIGYATGMSETTWTKFEGNPVLTTGAPGSWDPLMLRASRVHFNGRIYEMWYGGGADMIPHQTGYATSLDGIHWTKSPENPVLKPGPPESWDRDAAFPGDILFNGKMYSMWYSGNDGAHIRGGLAVSPKGITIDVPSGEYIAPRSGTVRLAVAVPDQAGLSFSVRIRAPIADEYYAVSTKPLRGNRTVDNVELFDDGKHGDQLAGDGLFANSWTTAEENLFFVDLMMMSKQKETRRFAMWDVGVFTTLGPVKLDSLIFLQEGAPTPGDTVLVKVVLRNSGSKEPVAAVTASLSRTDSLVSDFAEFSPSYGNIYAGSTAITRGYYRLYIHPDCPVNTDIKVNLLISSAGFQLWRDTFSIHVLPPWWRTNWAYALYGVLGLVVLYSVRRYEIRRTRQKHQLEMERFQAEKLKELDQLKSRFFANISHEFRTPLTLIQGPIEQMVSGEFKGDPEEQYRMILRNSQRLQQLVNQLLDLSKIESGQTKLHAREMDIVEMVSGIAASFESLATYKGIAFSINLPDEALIGSFDRDVVEKIVTNLLSNALKFTAEGGEVTVVLTPSFGHPSPTGRGEGEGFVILTVSDTGIGIPEQELPRIFDRFYQVDASQTREQEGTGLGLSLTKELVELHKGEITVTSALGKGSTFTVRLPMEMEHLRPDKIGEREQTETESVLTPFVGAIHESPLQDGPREIVASESLPLLLIVEDNADMRKYMRKYLDASYRIAEAVHGGEGLEKAVEAIPDLVISDVMMPKMDGFQLCGKLKTDERTSHIPIILLTAKAGTEHKIEGLETGADDYVTKPFDARELQARVKNLIDQRKKLREKFHKGGTFTLKDVAVTSADGRFLNRALEIVERHGGDRNFTTDGFANEMFMSRMQLHRKIRALTDLSPGEFVRRIRMEKARQLLQRHVGTIAEIAYQVGYEDPIRFSHAFRSQFGILPSEFAKQQSDKTSG